MCIRDRDKIYDNDDIKDVVRRIQSAGINIIANYIFGLPDDSLERMQQTFDLALELNCEFANFYSAMAYPGSPLYADAIKFGLELPRTWKDYSQHGYSSKPLNNQFCSSAEILGFRDRAFNTYFTHQPYLNLLQKKFGSDVVKHIKELTAIPLKRKLLED